MYFFIFISGSIDINKGNCSPSFIGLVKFNNFIIQLFFMKQNIVLLLFFLCNLFELVAQNTLKGIVVDGYSEKPLEGVKVKIKQNAIVTTTDKNGVFTLHSIPNGQYLIALSYLGYENQTYPVHLMSATVDLGTIYLFVDLIQEQDSGTIILEDDELNTDENSADYISGVLQASKDIYLRTAAFEFSPSFFRVRGLDSENNKVLINGVEMNKLYNGRPQWSNWGGLNDVLRNQELSIGLAPSNYTFGGVLGATNFNTKASLQRPVTTISYASSNRSYSNRIMATHSSGFLKNDWAYTVAASRRFGSKGFVNGTLYDANSFFISIEKKINEAHQLNFTGIIAYNRRGKNAPQTQEVANLKGITYNSYWGFQNSNQRNAREKKVFEPLFIINYDWFLNESTLINTNVSYQFGSIGNSRIAYNGAKISDTVTDDLGNPYIVSLGASNPDPTYYQKLPSYAIRQGYTNVYDIQQQFINNGQLNWHSLYKANTKPFNNGYASYVVYEDRNDDQQFSVNAILDKVVNDFVTINAKVQFTRLKSQNFATILDLLGGARYLDITPYANSFRAKQNNLLNPLYTAGVGDKFKYNFNLHTAVIDGFLQGQFNYKKIDFHFSGMFANSSHQRIGLFQNGGFPDNSLGKSEKVSFLNYGIKAGFTYKLSGRHVFKLNAGYLTKAPNLRDTFTNARENNNMVTKKVGRELINDLRSEKILSGDFSYIFRSPRVQAKATGYYAKIKDASEISFFYADGIGGNTMDNTAFVQEILKGVHQLHFGVELGIEAQVTATIKLKAAGNIGQYTYANNPEVYLTTAARSKAPSDRNTQMMDSAIFDSNGRTDDFIAHLKNYKIAAGPQVAYSIGFEYRNPKYWFVGATANFFDKIYVDTAPLTRTSNFLNDAGLIFNDYNPAVARELLQQERYNKYMVVNMIGGKSWKISHHYISVFVSIGNLLNTEFKSGGFEQGRNANYRQLKEDKSLEVPVFGNKYWFGRGTNYFLNLKYSF